MEELHTIVDLSDPDQIRRDSDAGAPRWPRDQPWITRTMHRTVRVWPRAPAMRASRQWGPCFLRMAGGTGVRGDAATYSSTEDARRRPRSRSKRPSGACTVMQRLHAQDLTATCLDLGYAPLCLPAEATSRTTITFPRSGRVVTRAPGGSPVARARRAGGDGAAHGRTRGVRLCRAVSTIAEPAHGRPIRARLVGILRVLTPLCVKTLVQAA